MRVVGLVLCVLLLTAALMGCGGGSIVGTWKHDTMGVAYEFTSDNRVTITLSGQNPVSGTYSLDKATNTLLLSVNEQQQSGIIDIKGNTLRITSPDSGSVVTMTRVR